MHAYAHLLQLAQLQMARKTSRTVVHFASFTVHRCMDRMKERSHLILDRP